MFPTPPHHNAAQSGVTAFNLRAVPLFEHLRWQGRFFRVFDRLTGHSPRLLALNDCLSRDMIRQPQAALIQPVELHRIQGSINRCNDFDRRFHPLHDHLRTRWVRVASLLLQNATLPPVELIRVQDCYFVVDGHHRVSAARALRHVTVDALLTAAYD